MTIPIKLNGETVNVVNIWVSELNFLMLKIEQNGLFKTYNLGPFNESENIFTELLKRS